MSNELVNTNGTENILVAAREAAGFDKILKFKKGEYLVGDEKIPLGTEYLAHPEAWTKCWIKFGDDKLIERHLYSVARGEKPPEREDLNDQDQSTWGEGLDGKPQDPWQLQFLLPLENATSGEIIVFATSSFGGKRAVGDLCSTWVRRVKRGSPGQPLVQLQCGAMQSKKYGKVPCPEFKVAGWDDTTGEAFVETPPPVESEKDFDDEIPY